MHARLQDLLGVARKVATLATSVSRKMTRSLIVLMAIAAPLSINLPAIGADCGSLSGLKVGDTTMTVAESVAAGAFRLPSEPQGGAGTFAGLPAFCRVHGIIKPTPSSAIEFEVWLPATGWNGRLEAVGNGGLGGTISYPAMATALKAGFATASTDTGHTADEPKDWLRNRDRLIDFSSRSLHLTTVNAKVIVNAFYSQPVNKAYYTGCSTGGRQGLMEAQEYPADFDGIVAGDAANFWTRQMMTEVWAAVATGTPTTNLSQQDLQLIQDSVLAQCDAMDGVKDGLIADPRKCRFEPKELLCKSGATAGCLSADKVAAVEKMYSGPVNPRTGAKLYEGLNAGNELGWGKDGGQLVIDRTSTSGVSSDDFMRYALFNDPSWEFRSFDFDRDTQAVDDKFAAITNATDPDLEEFRRLGHKLIYYHGGADPLIPAQNGIDYYESVQAMQAKQGKDAATTQAFFRAFLVPGMYHCSRGPGAYSFGAGQNPAAVIDADHDVVSAIVRWVEQGVAPEEIIAAKYIDNTPSKGVAFERPLCPYPLAAHYNGSGDPNKAANWSCLR
jgi:feruloyl esterase